MKMKPAFKKQLSIRNKMFLSYFFLIVIPVVIVVVLSYNSSKNIIDQQVSSSNQDTLTQISKNLETMLINVTAAINMYNISSDLENSLTIQDMTIEETLKNIQETEDDMQIFSLPIEIYSSQTILLGQNGMTYMNNCPTSLITTENISQYDWYEALVSNRHNIVWLNTHQSFCMDSLYRNEITAIKTLHHSWSKDIYGFLFISIDELDLYDVYKGAITDETQVFITDFNGNIISHSNRALVGQNMNSERYLELIRDTTRNSDIFNLDNIDKLVTYTKIDNLDWYVVHSISYDTLFEESRSLGRKIIIVAVLCILASIITSSLLSKRISKPIINLSNRIKNFSSRDDFHDMTYKTSTDMKIISDDHDTLIMKLEETVKEALRNQEDKRKAELQSLQMQINPHFLYNTLNAIKLLVWTNKVDLIEPTINAFSRLLKQTINTKNDLIPLEQELDNIKNYVYIHQIRTCDSLEISYVVDENLLKCLIPKLLLQPIVENAIFHGIEPKGSEGSITIYCRSYSDDIQIEILDNGVGMDKKAIDNLLTNNHSDDRYSFSGIGVKNVNERLKMYFGPEYGLTVESELNVGTSITIRMPKKMDN